MTPEIKQLKNGLKTLFINTPGGTASTVQMWFRAGSALEDKTNLGIAHFLEHMFFKGTKKRPGLEMTHEIESFGGEVNAFTSFDYTCYYINSPQKHLVKSIDILLDMVSNPQFLEKDLPGEKGVVQEEYLRYLDHPSQFNFMTLHKNYFSSGYNTPILGTPETIANFSLEQLRKFRETNYSLHNMLLVVGGDLQQRTEVEKLIESYSFPKGEKTHFPAFKIESDKEICLNQKHVNNASVTFCIQAPDYNDKKAALEEVAMSCFGHGETSRLYQNLVIKSSIADNVSVSSMYFQSAGSHFLKISLPPKNIKKALDAFIVSVQEALEGFSAQDIQKIKAQYLASKIYEKETLESYAFSLGHNFAQNGNIHCDEEFVSNIKQAQQSEINSAFQTIFKSPVKLTIQLPEEATSGPVLKLAASFLTQLKKASSSTKIIKKKGITQSKFDQQLTLTQIKKGIRLLYRYNPISPTFNMQVYLKSGLSNETKTTNGVHHMISSLLTCGHHQVDRNELKNFLENTSTTLNGFSGRNAYGLNMHGISENFASLVEHFFSSLLKPSFEQKDFKLEKEMTIRALHNLQKDPVKRLFEQVNLTMFNQHAYAMSLLGSKTTLNSFNNGKLLKSHLKNLNEKEILFTYCGSQSYEEVCSIIEDKIEHLKPRKEGRTPLAKINYKQKTHAYAMPGEQAHLFIGVPCQGGMTVENLCLKMLTTHLSGQSSKLFYELRDQKGLCYSVQPILFNAWDAGYWGIYIGTSNAKRKEATVAIHEILAEIKKDGLTREQFDKIKTMIEGQNQLSLQCNEDYANTFSVPLLHHEPLDHFFIQNQLTSDLKYEDFNKKIKSILNRKMTELSFGKLDS
jgi:zinc protease